MKAYFIFAIALTVAYIIYYAVMIARDLYGKNGEKIKSGEEEFDVSDFDEEESVSVVENDKGFNIGDNEYETHYIDETQNVSEETNPTDEKPKQDVIDALNNKVKANMEETQVTFSNPYNSADWNIDRQHFSVSRVMAERSASASSGRWLRKERNSQSSSFMKASISLLPLIPDFRVLARKD